MQCYCCFLLLDLLFVCLLSAFLLRVAVCVVVFASSVQERVNMLECTFCLRLSLSTVRVFVFVALQCCMANVFAFSNASQFIFQCSQFMLCMLIFRRFLLFIHSVCHMFPSSLSAHHRALSGEGGNAQGVFRNGHHTRGNNSSTSCAVGSLSSSSYHAARVSYAARNRGMGVHGMLVIFCEMLCFVTTQVFPLLGSLFLLWELCFCYRSSVFVMGAVLLL